jgi:cell shape-determining protein MreC
MQKRQTTIYIFLGFLALSIIVVLLSKLSIFSPISSLTQSIFSPLTTTSHSIFRLNSKQDTMREDYLSLSKKLVNQSKIEADNKALRDQFETQNVKSTSLIEANIVGSPSFIPGVTLPEYYILDKGERDGLVK